jgi:hypothetical protein
VRAHAVAVGEPFLTLTREEYARLTAERDRAQATLRERDDREQASRAAREADDEQALLALVGLI